MRDLRNADAMVENRMYFCRKFYSQVGVDYRHKTSYALLFKFCYSVIYNDWYVSDVLLRATAPNWINFLYSISPAVKQLTIEAGKKFVNVAPQCCK